MSPLHDLCLTESKLAEATSTPLGLTKIGWGLLQTQPGDRSSAGGDLTNRPAPRVPRGRRSSLPSPRWSGPPAVSTIKFKKKNLGKHCIVPLAITSVWLVVWEGAEFVFTFCSLSTAGLEARLLLTASSSFSRVRYTLGRSSIFSGSTAPGDADLIGALRLDPTL